MYLRTIQRRNKDGSVVRYVQMAHNVRHPESGNSVAKVLHSFGREDGLDRDGLERLVGSISRYLGIAGPDNTGGDEGLSLVSSRRLGGAWALDGLWRRVGIDSTMTRLAGDRRFGTDVERVLFALVANRALEPSSKLAATSWVTDRVVIDRLDTLDADTAYRAMDWLLEVEKDLATAVYWAVADLLNLEVACCSSTPPRPTSRPKPPMIPPRGRRSGFARGASPRTIEAICPRW